MSRCFVAVDESCSLQHSTRCRSLLRCLESCRSKTTNHETSKHDTAKHGTTKHEAAKRDTTQPQATKHQTANTCENTCENNYEKHRPSPATKAFNASHHTSDKFTNDDHPRRRGQAGGRIARGRSLGSPPSV